MPTYQYACTECSHAFEELQSFSDDALTECPQCEGRLRKLFNAVGVVFKGSGFYRNDSRKPAASESGSSTSDSDSSTTKKTEKEASPTSDAGSSTPSDSGSSPTKSGSSTTTPAAT